MGNRIIKREVLDMSQMMEKMMDVISNQDKKIDLLIDNSKVMTGPEKIAKQIKVEQIDSLQNSASGLRDEVKELSLSSSNVTLIHSSPFIQKKVAHNRYGRRSSISPNYQSFTSG
jgi:hypothetical protein